MRHLFFFFLAPSFSGLPLLPSVDACAACASAPSTVAATADAELLPSPVASGVDGLPLTCVSEGKVGSAVDVGTLVIGTLVACGVTRDAADTTDEIAEDVATLTGGWFFFFCLVFVTF